MGKFNFEYNEQQTLVRATYQASDAEAAQELFPHWTPLGLSANQAVLLDLFKNYGMDVARPLFYSFLDAPSGQTEFNWLIEAAKYNAETNGKKNYTIDGAMLKRMLQERRYVMQREAGDPLSGMYGDYHAQSIMNFAASRNYRKLICTLIRTGANLNEKLEERGRCILHIAIERNWADVMAACFERRDLIVDMPDGNKKSALHYSAESPVCAGMAMLIAHGANVNARDQFMNTPLHIAVMTANVEAVQLLLQRSNIGPSLSQGNRHGVTPLQLAYSKRGMIWRDADNEVSKKLYNICEMIEKCEKELKQAASGAQDTMQISTTGAASGGSSSGDHYIYPIAGASAPAQNPATVNVVSNNNNNNNIL